MFCSESLLPEQSHRTFTPSLWAEQELLLCLPLFLQLPHSPPQLFFFSCGNCLRCLQCFPPFYKYLFLYTFVLIRTAPPIHLLLSLSSAPKREWSPRDSQGSAYRQYQVIVFTGPLSLFPPDMFLQPSILLGNPFSPLTPSASCADEYSPSCPIPIRLFSSYLLLPFPPKFGGIVPH